MATFTPAPVSPVLSRDTVPAGVAVMQVRTGRPDEARRTTGTIDQPGDRAWTFGAMVGPLLEAGDVAAARRSAVTAARLALMIRDPAARSAGLAEAACALAAVGELV
jgi:hypothetical protein